MPKQNGKRTIWEQATRSWPFNFVKQSRSKYPNYFLGHAPLPVISLHSSFPYKEFGLLLRFCDATSLLEKHWGHSATNGQLDG